MFYIMGLSRQALQTNGKFFEIVFELLSENWKIV